MPSVAHPPGQFASLPTGFSVANTPDRRKSIFFELLWNGKERVCHFATTHVAPSQWAAVAREPPLESLSKVVREDQWQGLIFALYQV
jgi:hypothetical protein